MILIALATLAFAVAPARAPLGGPVDLPRSLSEDVPGAPTSPDEAPGLGEESTTPSFPGPELTRLPGAESEFSLGAEGGYLKARHADRGTWFGGAQARLHFLRILAAEASITFHENRYDNGDVHVTQYPVQLSGMLYPLPDGEFRPYALAGVGWYYTRVTTTGLLSGISNETHHVFGAHVGAGLELRLAPRTSIDGDVRYILLHPSSDALKGEDFNYWQITFGLNLFL